MELVSGMKFTHSCNCVHRDLKPSNLVFDESHRLYLCDFGSSILMHPDATATDAIGTPAYMAPEMHDDGAYTDKIDVYAFGLIVYEILTGHPVFSPNLIPLRIVKMLCIDNYRPVIPPTLDTWVHELINECWHQDSDRRPPFSKIEKTLLKHQFQLIRDADAGFLMSHFGYLNHQIQDRSQLSKR
jgi:serine/threonine protein kinase